MKKYIYIYIEDGCGDAPEEVAQMLCKVAACYRNGKLQKDGSGKSRKSLYHCTFDNNTVYVKNFFHVRKDCEFYQSEVLNAKHTAEMLEIHRKAMEVLNKEKGK